MLKLFLELLIVAYVFVGVGYDLGVYFTIRLEHARVEYSVVGLLLHVILWPVYMYDDSTYFMEE